MGCLYFHRYSNYIPMKKLGRFKKGLVTGQTPIIPHYVWGDPRYLSMIFRIFGGAISWFMLIYIDL
jgi:hypothetical protein